MNNHNEHFSEDADVKALFKPADRVTLTRVERGRVREILQTHIQQNPVRITESERLTGYRSLFGINQLTHYSMPIVLLLALLLGGGTSYAAESALPGDALYGVKVSINENVRSALAVSPKSEAVLQTKLASRRLEEAEALAEKGKLTPELRSDIVTRFQENTTRAQKELAIMNTSNNTTEVAVAAEINAGAESSMNTHGYILKAIALKKKGAVESEISEVLPVVQEKVIAFTKERSDNAEKIKEGSSTDIEAAARGKMGAAENKINEVKKAIERAKDRNDEWASVEAGARLQTAEEVFARGKVVLEAKEYNDAFLLFVKSMSIAQEAQTLAQVSNFTTIEIGIVSTERKPIIDPGPGGFIEVEGKDVFVSDELPRPGFTTSSKPKEIPPPGNTGLGKTKDVPPPGDTGLGKSEKIPRPGDTGLDDDANKDENIKNDGTMTVPMPWPYVLPKIWGEIVIPPSTGGGVLPPPGSTGLDKSKEIPPPGSTSDKLQLCPDAWIVDQMPKVMSSGLTRVTNTADQYFIRDGKRFELSLFDVYWIKQNCDIQPQVVW